MVVTYHRLFMRRNWTYFFAVCFALILAGCSFGNRNAEPTAAVNLPTYQAGAAVPTAEGTPASPQANAQPVNAAQAGNAQATQNNTAGAAGPLRYSGNVIAEHEIGVAVEVIGQVLKLPVQVGDSVRAGDVLLELDKTTLEAQRAQALAGLEAAQANLDLLRRKPSQSDLDSARAGVAAAEASYKHALDGPTAEDKRIALAQLYQAKAAVSVAQAAYDMVKSNPQIGALPQSQQLQQATLQLEAAQAQYDKILKGTTADVIANAYAQVAQARARLSTLEEGPKEEQVRAAQAQVHQAETQLYLAQVQLDKSTLQAPIDGVISAVNTSVGANAAPGAPIFTILSHAVKVEIAVESTRLAQIHVGQAAVIRVDAYPDKTFDGQISIIAPNVDPATRTVKVTIRPTGDATALAPGMFATVDLLEK